MLTNLDLVGGEKDTKKKEQSSPENNIWTVELPKYSKDW